MDLRQATRQLVRTPDPARWLKLADNYMTMYRKAPSSFILPAEHSLLKPVIDSYAHDPAAYVMYTKALRDGAKGTDAFNDLHDFYRTLSIRTLQVVRRTRIRKAVMLLQPELEKLVNRSVPYQDQVRVASMIEASWKRMRQRVADHARRERKAKTLSLEEQEIVYNDFWKAIDKTLEDGDVPLDMPIQEIVEALT